MREQMGPGAFKQRMEQELPYWINVIPQLPRLLHERLTSAMPQAALQAVAAEAQLRAFQVRNRWLAIIAAAAVGVLIVLVVRP
jgi:ubiquinone biosynthesis protein